MTVLLLLSESSNVSGLVGSFLSYLKMLFISPVLLVFRACRRALKTSAGSAFMSDKMQVLRHSSSLQL